MKNVRYSNIKSKKFWIFAAMAMMIPLSSVGLILTNTDMGELVMQAQNMNTDYVEIGTGAASGIVSFLIFYIMYLD